MKALVLIGIGGACGAIFRFLLSGCVQRLWSGTFPLGTCIVNVMGAFLVGILSVIFVERGEMVAAQLRALLVIGVLGGFTTFSTFSLESIVLWQEGAYSKLIGYMVCSVGGGLCATWLGMVCARKG